MWFFYAKIIMFQDKHVRYSHEKGIKKQNSPLHTLWTETSLETKKIKNFTNDIKAKRTFSERSPETCVL